MWKANIGPLSKFIVWLGPRLFNSTVFISPSTQFTNLINLQGEKLPLKISWSLPAGSTLISLSFTGLVMLCLALSCHYRSIPRSLPMSCREFWSNSHIFEHYRSRQIPVFAIVSEVLFLKYLATQFSFTRIFLPLWKVFSLLYCLFFYFHAGPKYSCLPKILSRQKKKGTPIHL